MSSMTIVAEKVLKTEVSETVGLPNHLLIEVSNAYLQTKILEYNASNCSSDSLMSAIQANLKIKSLD